MVLRSCGNPQLNGCEGTIQVIVCIALNVMLQGHEPADCVHLCSAAYGYAGMGFMQVRYVGMWVCGYAGMQAWDSKTGRYRVKLDGGLQAYPSISVYYMILV